MPVIYAKFFLMGLWFLGPIFLFSTSVTAGQTAGGAGWQVVSLFIVAMWVSFGASVQICTRQFIGRNQVVTMVLVAALLASFGVPCLDDDLYRYIWDGYVSAKGLKPHIHPPVGGAEGFPATVYRYISYREVPSMYPPGAIVLFQGLWNVFQQSVDLWLKFMALVTVLTVFVFVRLAKAYSTSNLHVCFLLLNPLLIKEFADSAHYDVICILLTGVALLVSKDIDSRLFQRRLRFGLVAMLLAVASLLKVYPLLLVPMWPDMNWKKRGLLLLLTTILVFLGLYLYFDDYEDWLVYSEALRYFQKYWVFFPNLSDVLQWALSRSGTVQTTYEAWSLGGSVSKAIGLCGYILAFVFVNYRNLRAEVGLLWGLGSFIVFQPVVNVWYIFWLWPILLIQPREHFRAVLFWGSLPMICLFGYTFWAELTDIRWLRWLAWGLWVGWGWLLYRTSWGKKEFFSS